MARGGHGPRLAPPVVAATATVGGGVGDCVLSRFTLNFGSRTRPPAACRRAARPAPIEIGAGAGEATAIFFWLPLPRREVPGTTGLVVARRA